MDADRMRRDRSEKQRFFKGNMILEILTKMNLSIEFGFVKGNYSYSVSRVGLKLIFMLLDMVMMVFVKS